MGWGGGRLILWGCILHVVMLYAAFDIYFRSPIVGSNSISIPQNFKSLTSCSASARRLVLIVADGLRLESFVKTNEAPYLKSVIQNRGTWGISRTHIPTESRPGHVAIIAGFFEDPSAVTRGWKENPVEFDSLFNQSRYTWSWGSPDILPMFAKGIPDNHVYTYSYSHEEEDFSGKTSTSNLDLWVFDHVEEFLKKAENDEILLSKLKNDKIVLFLHLLGLDTAGHTHKPNSIQYENNIKTVDSGISKIEGLIEKFYNFDNQTSYIFTADHGMTDWGSHGAGSAHETETPFIAWGAGINAPMFSQGKTNPTENNLRQVDICPLMATLINVDIPIDSVGILPDTYLKMSTKEKVSCLHNNMKQILLQYELKKKLIEDTAIKQIYKPFPSLMPENIQQFLKEIEISFDAGNFENAIFQIKQFIDLCLMGSNYYQNYYQNILLKCMTANFIGWICWLFTILLQDFNSNDNCKKLNRKYSFVNLVINISFGTILAISFGLIYVQKLPFQYYVYFSLSLFHWWKVLSSWNSWYTYIQTMKRTSNSSYLMKSLKILLMVFIYIIGVVILIMTFFHRWYLSIGLIALALFPMVEHRKKIPTALLLFWFLSCILLSGFPFLPVIGRDENKHLVGASGLLWFISSFIFLFKYSLPMLKSGKETKRENIIMLLPLIMMITAIQVKYVVALNFSSKGGLPIVCQYISWILAVLSFIIPLLSSRWIMSRIFTINTSLAVFFILLSVSHEGFFLLFLCINLFCWLIIEHYIENGDKGIELLQYSFKKNPKSTNFNRIIPINRKLNASDFRRSFIFLLYIILSFFGTGNIASVNSFDPQWIRCFVAQFSPFTMAALILCKTLIPFLCVASLFYAVNLVVKAPTGNLFIIVLIFSDLMSLQFLHMITNVGSWLDIGTSISHYVIMETTVFFVSILYGLGQILTETSGWITEDKKNVRPKNT